jgi:hypothetical protein
MQKVYWIYPGLPILTLYKERSPTQIESKYCNFKRNLTPFKVSTFTRQWEHRKKAPLAFANETKTTNVLIPLAE